MASKKLEDIFKYHFEHELARKDQLLTHLSIPIGFLTLTSGIFVYFIQHLPLNDESTRPYYFLGLLLLALGLYGRATVYVAMTFYGFRGYEYAFLPSAKVQKDYYQGYLDHYRDDYSRERLALSQLQGALSDWYCECAEINRAVNIQRAGYIHRANESVALMLLCLVLSTIPFSMSRISAYERTLDSMTVTVKYRNPPFRKKSDIQKKTKRSHGRG